MKHFRDLIQNIAKILNFVRDWRSKRIKRRINHSG